MRLFPIFLFCVCAFSCARQPESLSKIDGGGEDPKFNNQSVVFDAQGGRDTLVAVHSAWVVDGIYHTEEDGGMIKEIGLESVYFGSHAKDSLVNGIMVDGLIVTHDHELLIIECDPSSRVSRWTVYTRANDFFSRIDVYQNQ